MIRAFNRLAEQRQETGRHDGIDEKIAELSFSVGTLTGTGNNLVAVCHSRQFLISSAATSECQLNLDLDWSD